MRLKRSVATRTLDPSTRFLLFDRFGSVDPDDDLAGFPMHPLRDPREGTFIP